MLLKASIRSVNVRLATKPTSEPEPKRQRTTRAYLLLQLPVDDEVRDCIRAKVPSATALPPPLPDALPDELHYSLVSHMVLPNGEDVSESYWYGKYHSTDTLV